MTIAEKLNLIERKINDRQFRDGKGVGNEVNFHILDYDPKDEMIVREHIRFLKKKVENTSAPYKIREINLFATIIECLKEKNYFEKALQLEKDKGSEKFIDTVKNSLGLKTDNSFVVKKIVDQIEKNDIVFLTGVGSVFPIIRTHKLLNNLHPFVVDNPLVLFLPGDYSGLGVRLFGIGEGDNYYRAFRLI